MELKPTNSAAEPARYWVQLPDGVFALREVRGSEHLSKPYRLELEMRMDPGQTRLTAAALSRCEVFVGMHRGESLQRVLRGVATEIRVGASLGGTPDVHLVVEPHLALLRHRSDSRVFRDKTVPEIVDMVLEPFEWMAEWRLQGSYPVRPYTVQYQESDLDFIHRLLEDEGIFYFIPDWGDFDQADENPPVVVCCDHAAAYQPMAGDAQLAFIASHGLDTGLEHIIAIGPRKALTVSKVSLRDFNADKPSLAMDVAADGPSEGSVEFYEYPGKYKLPPEGERKVGLMSEAFARAADLVDAQSDCARLRPGGRFELGNAPAGLADGGHAIRHVEHRWNREADTFLLGFTCMPEALTYRPPRVTPAPRITNPLTGFVRGPEGADIHCDEMGRVKVRFPWDRLQPQDDTVSDWIPVLQDNTGSSSAIPRTGWEVLVGFLEGDPDRPIVLGRMYNGEDPFPEPLPAGKTRSALKSLNSPGRDGHNLFRMDDIAGNELVTLHAEKDQTVNVAMNKKEQVLNAESNWVGGNETISVGANNETVVGKSSEMTVQGDQTTAIGASQKTQVADDTSNDVAGSRHTTIGGMHYRRIEADDTVTTGVLVELVGGLCLETSIKPNKTSSSKLQTLTIGGALVEATCKDKSETAQTKRLETVGGLINTDAATDIAIRADGARATTVGGSLSINGEDRVLLSGIATVGVKSVGASTYKAASVTCKVGGSSVVFEGGNIVVKSAGKIVLDGGGAASLLADLGDINPGGGGGGGGGGGAGTPGTGAAAGGQGAAGAAAGKAGSGPGGDVSSVLSDFDKETQDLAGMSPTLTDQLNQLEEDGWTVKQGNPGEGSWCDQSAKEIVIDPSESAEDQVAGLAHEAAHAGYDQPYHGMEGKTRDEYVDANVDECMKDEGQAQFNTEVVGEEIEQNGGGPIDTPGGGDYSTPYEDYQNGDITQEEAVDQMANEIRGETTSTTGENYEDYYGQAYEDHWDENHKDP